MRSIPALIPVAAVVLAAMPTSMVAQHFPPDEDLQLMLRYMVEDGVAPGIVVGLVESDGSTRIVSYGSGGPGTRPLGPQSVFDLGSINKTFTATVLAEMVARGEVDLEDPIAQYLPASVTVPTYEGREITLVDLATHTSGLPRLADNYRFSDMRDPYADYTVEILYEFLSLHELRREPGTRFQYSNLGYGLLGHVLARAADMSYQELLRERVLDPLSMSQTEYGSAGEMGDWVVWGHHYGKPVPFWHGTEAIEGAGGLRSSVSDMLNYMKASIGPAKSALEHAMQASHVPLGEVTEGGVEYGLSWMNLSLGGQSSLLMHSGGTGGFSTLIAFIPERRVGLVSLANSRGADTNLEELLRFGLPPEEWGGHVVAPGVLAGYAGRYRSASGNSESVIRLENEGFLTYQPKGRSRARLYAKSDSTFYLLQGPWTFTFPSGGEGEAQGLRMEVDERDPNGGLVRSATWVGEGGPPSAVLAGNAGFAVTFTALTEPIIWTVYGWGPLGWAALGLVVLLLTALGIRQLVTWRRRRTPRAA